MKHGVKIYKGIFINSYKGELKMITVRKELRGAFSQNVQITQVRDVIFL